MYVDEGMHERYRTAHNNCIYIGVQYVEMSLASPSLYICVYIYIYMYIYMYMYIINSVYTLITVHHAHGSSASYAMTSIAQTRDYSHVVFTVLSCLARASYGCAALHCIQHSITACNLTTPQYITLHHNT